MQRDQLTGKQEGEGRDRLFVSLTATTTTLEPWVPTIKVLPAVLAVAAAGAAAFFGFTQPPPDHPVVQQSTVHDENDSLTAERIVELERTRQIRPAGPIPVDKNANVIEPKR